MVTSIFGYCEGVLQIWPAAAYGVLLAPEKLHPLTTTGCNQRHQPPRQHTSLMTQTDNVAFHAYKLSAHSSTAPKVDITVPDGFLLMASSLRLP